MDSDVAGSAILEAGIRHVVGSRLCRHAGSLAAESARAVVAFQTHRENNRALEEPRIRRPVRRVAGLAAVHAQRRMFEDERPTFFAVALQAGFFVC